MRAHPVRYLAAGLMLVGLSGAGLLSPSALHMMDLTAARIGAGTLAWAFLLIAALGLILTGCAAVARQALIRAESLRLAEALAEARSLSFFADEALGGVIALGDMGRRVEMERQSLNARAGLLALTAAAAVGLGGLALGLGVHGSAPLGGVLAAMAASAGAAAILLARANSIRRISLNLTPTAAQVHAALARHQEREEAERRMLRPSLALIGDPPALPLRG